jgi:hypothetical protein
LGIGALSGVVAGGVTARLVDAPSSSRILLLDLGLGLGGLTGAAVASPLVFGDGESKGRTRLWLGAIGAGFVAGGLTAYLLTDSDGSSDSADGSMLLPEAGVIGFDRDGPVVGGAIRGIF